MWFLLAFIAVPLIEIGLFIQVGGAIGLWPTLGIVILTAIVGTMMLRGQGLAALANLQNSFRTLNDPTVHLAHGAMIIFAGALLLTPGFFTDAVGFSLLIPPVRTAIIKFAKSRITFVNAQTQHPHGQEPAANQTIDGEFTEVSPAPGDSKWTKH